MYIFSFSLVYSVSSYKAVSSRRAGPLPCCSQLDPLQLETVLSKRMNAVCPVYCCVPRSVPLAGTRLTPLLSLEWDQMEDFVKLQSLIRGEEVAGDKVSRNSQGRMETMRAGVCFVGRGPS